MKNTSQSLSSTSVLSPGCAKKPDLLNSSTVSVYGEYNSEHDEAADGVILCTLFLKRSAQLPDAFHIPEALLLGFPFFCQR